MQKPEVNNGERGKVTLHGEKTDKDQCKFTSIKDYETVSARGQARLFGSFELKFLHCIGTQVHGMLMHMPHMPTA